MASRDKYGNYVNDEGVRIKITTDKLGNDHIGFYGDEVDKEHDAAHVNINYDKESWSATTHGPDKSDTSSSSGNCFLTSACIQNFQDKFVDNCYELTVLRWFRDNFVSNDDVLYYYQVAPNIVNSINKSKHKDNIYQYIYDEVVKYCVNKIENKQYDEAYSRYKIAVFALEEKYLNNTLGKTLKKVYDK